MQPKVSIITITYNAGEFLERTVKSILSQTYPGIEYVIVDGKSTDGTLPIIKKYEKHIARWVSEPDKGLYHAMNKGLRMATGDYAWFINAGDEIYAPHTVDSLINQAPGADVFFGETMITDKNGKDIGLRRLRPGKKFTWKSLRNGMLVSHQSFIVRRGLAPEYNLDYRYAADFDWMVRCMKQARAVHNTGMVLSRFMDGGRTKQTIVPGLKERFRIMAGHFGFLPTVLHHIPIAIKFFWFWGKNKRF